MIYQKKKKPKTESPQLEFLRNKREEEFKEIKRGLKKPIKLTSPKVFDKMKKKYGNQNR